MVVTNQKTRDSHVSSPHKTPPNFILYAKILCVRKILRLGGKIRRNCLPTKPASLCIQPSDSAINSFVRQF